MKFFSRKFAKFGSPSQRKRIASSIRAKRHKILGEAKRTGKRRIGLLVI